MESLRRLCVDAGVEVQYVALTRSKRILGWYYHAWDGQPIIALDEDLPRSPRLGRCVLAEKLAHHEVGATDSLVYSLSDEAYSLRQMGRARAETKALRRAAEILIPTKELAQAIREGLTTIDELSQRFNVVPGMVVRRLNFIRQDLQNVQGLRVMGVADLFAPVLVDNLWGLEGNGHSAVSCF